MRALNIGVLLLAFFAMFGLSGAATTAYVLPSSFIAASLLALTISIDVVAIGYVIARLVPSTGIRSWLDTEYWELAKSAMIIIGIYAILAFIGSVSLIVYNSYYPSISHAASPACGYSAQSAGSYSASIGSLASAAGCYLSNTASEVGTAMQDFFFLSESLGGLRSITLTIEPPIVLPDLVNYLQFGFSTKIYANQLLEQGVTTGKYESMINDLFSIMLIPIALLIAVQQVGLGYIVAIGLGFLIPLGLVFRAFPFIRGIGGTLIGIGVALAVVYPATLVLLNMPVSNAFVFLAPTTSSMTSVAASSGVPVLFNIVDALLPPPIALGILGASIAPLFAYVGEIYTFLDIYLFYGTYLLLQFLLFILDLVIVYALGDNIARMLGGTFRLSFGNKLKLA
ncbi:MAG: hypothetical protein ACP5T3_00290 [Candidatus Micrarchaeia archaeon]